MRVGILTHVLSTNYGGILQNYALQQVLKMNGYEPITIAYSNSVPLYVRIGSMAHRLYRRLKGQKVPIRAWTTRQEQEVISQYTQEFIHKYIAQTETFDIDSIGKAIKYNFDALIVGSDQVWRGDGRPVEKFYFSAFTNCSIPKIAYAASFGSGVWNYDKRQTKKCSQLIQYFTGVSVRESDAIDLCKRYLNVNAQLVLDPTMLISSKDYESLITEKGLPAIDYPNMMVYILDETGEKRKIVQEASQHLSLAVNRIRSQKYFSEVGHSGLNQCIFPSVEEWLRGFRDADFVITDSFHGTVFSVIFNKPFISIINEERGASRFYSLLDMFNLRERLVTRVSDLTEMSFNKIDYTKVNKIIERQRSESLAYLFRSLNQ